MDQSISSTQAGLPAPLLQSPDLCLDWFDRVNDFVLVFNNYLRAIYVNNKCLDFLKHRRSSVDFLLGRDFVEYAPDYREIETWYRFMNEPAETSAYSLDSYDAISTLYRHPLYVNVQLLRKNDLLCAIVTETTEQVISFDNQKKQAVRIAELENYCEKLKNTIEVLLQRNGDQKTDFKGQYLCILEETILPLVDMLKTTRLDDNQLSILDILSSNLNSSILPFLQQMSSDAEAFTAREVQIANLIRLGKTTKEIAGLLYLSCKTVDFHRANIRKKLKLSSTAGDLSSFLRGRG